MKIKVVHINTHNSGGAFLAAYRLHQGLLREEVNSNLVTLYHENEQVHTDAFLANQNFLSKLKHAVKYRTLKRKQQKALRNKNKTLFSFPESAFDIHQHPSIKNADIVHLHWVANFLDYESFFKKVNKPIIWTLHDMNPFSGGFHCKTSYDPDYAALDKRILEEKLKALKKCEELHIVSPSKWLHDDARNSRLMGQFAHYHIPNGLDTRVFRTYQKDYGRSYFGLPKDKKIILFAAASLADRIKGASYLMGALRLLPVENIFVAIVGDGRIDGTGYASKQLGFISKPEEMAIAYSAADVFILPSIDDNFPNTMLEALSCGTPIVSFRIGGMSEVIKDGFNGLFAEEVSAQSLAKTIQRFLRRAHDFDRDTIRADAVRQFDQSVQAKRYMALYKSILEKM